MGLWETHSGYTLAEYMKSACETINKNTPTLRDQFAMNALVALLQRPINSADEVTRIAYDFADKMLEVRKEKK